jgi:hypothetical protein
MAGRRFASFPLEVSAGDVLREPFEILEGHDWLGFAGIARATLPAISREEQFAEKLHAYTLPRKGRPNTRVENLVDTVLLVDSATLDSSRLVEIIKATFSQARHSWSAGIVISTLAKGGGAFWRTGFGVWLKWNSA